MNSSLILVLKFYLSETVGYTLTVECGAQI